MDIVQNEATLPVEDVPSSSKPVRVGRWSKGEKQLFQCLLYRFGNNWKMIQQVLKTRSLSQIRSHAQKLFDKLDPAKKLEYKKTANLFQSIQLMRSEMLLNQQKALNSQVYLKPELSVVKDQIYMEKDDITDDSQESKNRKTLQQSQQKYREFINCKDMRSELDNPFSRNNLVPVLNSYPSSFAPYII